MPPPKPPLMRIFVTLVLWPGSRGSTEVTLKLKVQGLLKRPSSISKAVRDITGSLEMFFKVISTFGPAGVIVSPGL